jgi:hypothetical protein
MAQAAAAEEQALNTAHSWIGEVFLRLLGAAFQVGATWALVHALTPHEAGVYFRGFVIALGLSTVMRGKYELYVAQHIIGAHAAGGGIPNFVLLRELGRRLLLRSTVVCAVLLIVTADLDIQAPQLQTELQTYLPFVLSLPFVSLSSLLCEALRAVNRTLGIVLAAYAVNLSILLAVLLAPPDASLALYSWAFLLGSVISTVMAGALAWRAFPVAREVRYMRIPRETLAAVDSRELIGLARGALLWGPLCILSVWAPAVDIAQYAVAARTALVVDYFLPALNLTASRETLSTAKPAMASRGLLIRQLVVALVSSSAFIVPLLVLAPMTLALFGKPYDSQLTVYVLLLGVQWLNGVGRPAIRRAVMIWDTRLIGIAVGSGALAAILVCALGVQSFGALAAAAGSLLGALIVSGRAIAAALARA